ncbi:sulfatase [Bacteroidota bacterium]
MKNISRREFVKRSSIGAGALTLGLGCNLISKKKRPNIIFIITDDQRWDALGCAGNNIIHTPNMDKLAEKGIRFENAYVTTPICASSRASAFTGLYERTHKYTFTKPPVERKYTDTSYPVLLKKSGYKTGFIGKFGIKVEEGVRDEMFDWVKWGSLPYFKKDNPGRHMTEIHGDQAIDFIREHNSDQAFCLSLSFWAPHADDGKSEQYFWPSSCNNLYKDKKIPVPKSADPAFFNSFPDFLKKSMNRERWYWRFDNPQKYQNMVKGYYRMISGVDEVLGRITDELKANNIDNNTIIILTGDNGYFLGERGFAGKWLMHDPSIHIPIIIYDPRNTDSQLNKKKNEFVLNIDITKTILDYAGLEIPEIMQGRSLVSLLNNKNNKWRDNIFCEHLWDHPDIPQSECIRNNNWKYIRYQKHKEYIELYDLKNDPDEINNLAFKKEYSDLVSDFNRKCDEKIELLIDN